MVNSLTGEFLELFHMPSLFFKNDLFLYPEGNSNFILPYYGKRKKWLKKKMTKEERRDGEEGWKKGK